MKFPKFSIIVPVYNIESYIADCICGVQNQTYSNWELILVNDGSSDNSAEVCRRFCENDTRISLINQENQGVSQARNAGIRKSTGDYITFIDGDDFWNADVLSVICKQIEENCEIDIWLATEYELHYPSGKRRIIKRNCNQADIGTVLSKEETVKYILESRWSVCLAFVKRELIESGKVYFIPTAKLGEDADWMFRVCLESVSTGFISSRYYRYNYSREGSAMTTKSQEVCTSYLEVVKSWIEMYRENNTQLIYMITRKLANNCASYIDRVYDFDNHSKEKWRSFVMEYKMYEYLDGEKSKIWRHFDKKNFFDIYIWRKAMQRKVLELCKKIVRKFIKER